MSVGICAHVCEDLRRSKQGIRSPEAGYTDCGPPNMGAGNSFTSKTAEPFRLSSYMRYF